MSARLPASHDFSAALRLRHDPVALAACPLARLPAVRRRAATAYRREAHAVGLALRDLLDQAIATMAADLARQAERSGRAGEDGLALAILAEGGSAAEAARRLGICRTSARMRHLYALRGRLLRRFLELATAP